MRWRLRRIRKPQVFALLMIAAAGFVLLPRDYFGSARSIAQLVAVAPQKAGNKMVRAIDGGISDLRSTSISVEEQEKTLRESRALSNQNVSLRHQVEERDAKIATLTRI